MSRLDHDEPTTGIDPLQELGKQLPWDRPDAARREAVRSSLLVAAADTPPRRSSRALLAGAGFVAGALAAAAVALLLVRAPSSSSSPSTGRHERYAQIESSSVAELEHTSTATSTGTDEVVRVRAGTVRLAVPTLRTGDRVRTKTGNAEVEGTGAYEVVVANDKLTKVHVASGTAKVIVDGQTIVLASGETWTAPIITTDLSPSAEKAAASDENAARVFDETTAHVVDETAAAVAGEKAPVVGEKAPVIGDKAAVAVGEKPPLVVATKTPRSGVRSPQVSSAEDSSMGHEEIGSSPVPNDIGEINADALPRATPSQPAITSTPTPSLAPTTASSSEQHFQTGWALLRDNKYSAAADELALAAAGTGPLALDARYFQAVALTKANRTKEAETALVAFLDRAPTSARRGRAAVMLGRLIAARGDTTSARAWFTSALDDPDASVAGAARAELAKLK
ncbi:MAG: tol-pal system YbgF family protein [Kofleriaceae bacterium]